MKNQKTLGDHDHIESKEAVQVWYIKEMMDSPWWKLLYKEIEKIMKNIKSNLRLPCTDESMRFNSRNLLNERLAVFFVIQNLAKMKLWDLSNIVNSQKDHQMTVQERLEKENKKLSAELTKYIQL